MRRTILASLLICVYIIFLNPTIVCSQAVAAATCKDIELALDENGYASIFGANGIPLIDNGSYSTCPINNQISYSVSIEAFDCNDLTQGNAQCASSIMVILTIEDACNNSVSCQANVRIIDDIPPELVCPENKTVNLDAGECGIVHGFVLPYAKDNCEGVLTTTFLGTTFIDNNGFAGNMFDVENTGNLPITISMFDLHFGSSPGSMHMAQAWYTHASGTYVGNETDASAWTSLGSSMVVSSGPGNPTPFPVGGLVINPGESFGIYIAQTDGGADIDYTNGNNTYSDAHLTISTGVGKGNPAFTGSTFNSRTWNGNVHYTFIGGNISIVEQTDGTDLTSGDFFGEGIYFWTYSANDGCGNTSDCSFSLEVTAFPEEKVSTSLACNNGPVNLSLDQNCVACINADFILEGGPYGCYDDYVLSSNGYGSVISSSYGSGTNLCFGINDMGQNISVTVTDPETGNSCWGYVFVEDKLRPVIHCQDTLNYRCYDAKAILAGDILSELPSVDECSDYELSFTDFTEGDDCNGKVITRTWIAADASGFSGTCETRINILPLESETDILPPSSLVVLTCGADTSPSGIASFFDDPDTKDDLNSVFVENNEGYWYAYPTFLINGHPQKIEDKVCQFIVSFTDVILEACGAACHGNKKIIRTWDYFDWCTEESGQFVQIIKASDQEPPTYKVDDITVSTHAWDCYADFKMPHPTELHDNCDLQPGYSISGPPWIEIRGNDVEGFSVFGLNRGVHDFFYTAFDCCGNEFTSSIHVEVRDKTAPVVTTKQDIVLSLTPDSPDGEGQAQLFAAHIDNGSFDNCTPLHLEIRRSTATPPCDNTGLVQADGTLYNNNQTFNNTDITFTAGNHPDDNRNDTDGGQFVKFCCEDLTAAEVDVNGDGVIDTGYVMVILRAWDDANLSGVFGDEVNGHRDNYNEGWAFVKVEDKLPPILSCPPAATIYCDWGIDMSTDFGPGFQDASLANFDKTGVAEAYSTCGPVPVFFSDAAQLDDCGVGTIIRQFRATTQSKTGPKVVTCQQIITVLPRPSQFSVTPPNPNPLSVGCALTEDDLYRRRPSVSGGACDVIGENVKVDTFLFENGVCKKWRAEWNYFNWCTGEEMGPFYSYYVYEDTEKPVLHDCEDRMFGVDANCQHVLALTNRASDSGGCTEDGWLKWQVFLDTWADGTVGHYASSFVSSSTYRNWKAVAGNDPILPGGVVYNDVVWVKYLAPTPAKDTGEVEVTFEAEVIEGKMSNHKVLWKVTDGCHNDASCGYDIMVADKKAPTPYCVHLSTALMDSGWVELWARDFDKGSFDNCTKQEDLYFTFNQIGAEFADTLITAGTRTYLVNADVPHFFDDNGFVDFDGDGITYPKAKNSTLQLYYEGEIQKWVPEFNSSSKIFDCDELAVQGADGFVLRMSVWDEKLNTDYCIVYLMLVDNHDDCEVSGSRVAGRVLTYKGEEVSGVQVNLENTQHGFTESKIVNGYFTFENLPVGNDYMLSAGRDGDDLNGISTLDLIILQRHLLGLSKLGNPYQLIAADVNKDKQVRISDLVELRKLILGLDQELMHQNSWIMLDGNEDISMHFPLNYNELIYVDGLDDFMRQDFIAVKVGDVSGDAYTGVKIAPAESRNKKQLIINCTDQDIETDQELLVSFSTQNFDLISGFQFTFQSDGLEFIEAEDGIIQDMSGYLGIPKRNFWTISWNNSMPTILPPGLPLFSLRVKAEKSGKLSEMLKLNSSITKAESYFANEFSRGNVDLHFNDGSDSMRGSNISLLQNEPNPFKSYTSIPFNVPEAGRVILTIIDVNGKVILSRSMQVSEGMNMLRIQDQDITGTGMYYYKLVYGGYIGYGKMIKID